MARKDSAAVQEPAGPAQPQRVAPWVPGMNRPAPDGPTAAGQPDAKTPGTVDDWPPELIFDPAHNWSPSEIHARTGIPLQTIVDAADNREISCVFTQVADVGGKAWKGDKVAAWIRRHKFPLNPPASVRNQVASAAIGLRMEAETAKRRQAEDEAARDRVGRIYREAAERLPQLVDVLQVLETMREQKHTAADVLRILATPTTPANPV